MHKEGRGDGREWLVFDVGPTAVNHSFHVQVAPSRSHRSVRRWYSTRVPSASAGSVWWRLGSVLENGQRTVTRGVKVAPIAPYRTRKVRGRQGLVAGTGTGAATDTGG